MRVSSYTLDVVELVDRQIIKIPMLELATFSFSSQGWYCSD